MPRYDEAIAWIAKHVAGNRDDSQLAAATTVAMVSDLFGVNEGIVVQDVRSEQRMTRSAPTVRTVADVRRERAR